METKQDLDAYQQAVEYLTERPSEIPTAWESCGSHEGGCLFEFVRTGPFSVGFNGGRCGCLTMIRHAHLGMFAARTYQAPTEELNAAIVADGRIPLTGEDITIDHLPIFAGWQRRIDQVLNRTPRALDPRLPAPKGDIEIPAIELGVSVGTLCASTLPAAMAEGERVGGGGA